jgi:hypothetical protein
VQTSIAVDAFRRARVDGRRPGPAAGFGLVYVYRCRALSSARIFSFLTVVVLLLLVAEGLVCGRVGRDWVAIRGMEVAAETIGIARYGQNCSCAFEIDRSFQISMRKEY